MSRFSKVNIVEIRLYLTVFLVYIYLLFFFRGYNKSYVFINGAIFCLILLRSLNFLLKSQFSKKNKRSIQYSVLLIIYFISILSLLIESILFGSSYGWKTVSPGKDERRKKAKSTGTAFDKRANYLGVYFPGTLYLLNVHTKNYIEWETGQGDSEILLVQDETVYYRVNDKIFKASIIDGEKLGESELLIQDDRVPDIHWAFIAKN